MDKDFYKILSVKPNATQKEISAASDRLLSVWGSITPETDRNYDRHKKILEDIRLATSVLKDPEKRSEYDRKHGFGKKRDRRRPPDKVPRTEKVEDVEISKKVEVPGRLHEKESSGPLEEPKQSDVEANVVEEPKISEKPDLDRHAETEQPDLTDDGTPVPVEEKRSSKIYKLAEWLFGSKSGTEKPAERKNLDTIAESNDDPSPRSSSSSVSSNATNEDAVSKKTSFVSISQDSFVSYDSSKGSERKGTNLESSDENIESVDGSPHSTAEGHVKERIGRSPIVRRSFSQNAVQDPSFLRRTDTVPRSLTSDQGREEKYGTLIAEEPKPVALTLKDDLAIKPNSSSERKESDESISGDSVLGKGTSQTEVKKMWPRSKTEVEDKSFQVEGSTKDTVSVPGGSDVSDQEITRELEKQTLPKHPSGVQSYVTKARDSKEDPESHRAVQKDSDYYSTESSAESERSQKISKEKITKPDETWLEADELTSLKPKGKSVTLSLDHVKPAVLGSQKTASLPSPEKLEIIKPVLKKRPETSRSGKQELMQHMFDFRATSKAVPTDSLELATSKKLRKRKSMPDNARSVSSEEMPQQPGSPESPDTFADDLAKKIAESLFEVLNIKNKAVIKPPKISCELEKSDKNNKLQSREQVQSPDAPEFKSSEVTDDSYQTSSRTSLYSWDELNKDSESKFVSKHDPVQVVTSEDLPVRYYKSEYPETHLYNKMPKSPEVMKSTKHADQDDSVADDDLQGSKAADFKPSQFESKAVKILEELKSIMGNLSEKLSQPHGDCHCKISGSSSATMQGIKPDYPSDTETKAIYPESEEPDIDRDRYIGSSPNIESISIDTRSFSDSPDARSCGRSVHIPDDSFVYSLSKRPHHPKPAMTSQSLPLPDACSIPGVRSIAATTMLGDSRVKSVYHFGPTGTELIEVFVDDQLRAKIVKDEHQDAYSNVMRHSDFPAGSNVSASTVIAANGCQMRTDVCRRGNKETIAVYRNNVLLCRTGNSVIE